MVPSLKNFNNSPNKALGKSAMTTPAPTAFNILLKRLSINMRITHSESSKYHIRLIVL